MADPLYDLMSLPQEFPPVGAGLQGYEQYDPNTLAMMRMRNAVKPPGGRPGEGPTIPDILLTAAGGPIMRGVGAAAKAISRSKLAGATLGSILGLETTSEAGEGSKEQSKSASDFQPRIDEITKRIESAQAEIKRLGGMTVAEPKTNRRATPREREAAANRATQQQQNITSQIDNLKESIKSDIEQRKQLSDAKADIEKTARLQAERERPLVEQQPWMKALPIAGGVAAATAAYNPRVRALIAHNEYLTKLAEALPAAEKAALRSGKATRGDALATNTLEQLMTAYPGVAKSIEPGGFGAKLGKASEAAIGGGALSAEMALLPTQLDLAQRPGTQAYDTAIERLTTPEGWGKTGAAAFAGLTGGSLGATLPAWPAARMAAADVARAKALLETIADRGKGAGTGTPAAKQFQAVPIQSLPAPQGPTIWDLFRHPGT